MSTLAIPVLAPLYRCDPNCGLCCKHLIVEATPLDVLREPLIAERCDMLDGRGELTPGQSNWLMGSSATHECVFLSAANRCGIYATRPNVCVMFQAGSEKCQELRQQHGLAPPEPCEAVTVPERIAAEFAGLDEDDFE